MIRSATAADAAAITAIYNHYILHTPVTFEEEAITAEEMAGRMAEVQQAYNWFVAEQDGKVLGYAYAGKWKSRCAYRYTVESTVYLDKDAVGRGLGTQLYRVLLADLRQRRIHNVIGGIALPNAGSVALHEKLGFQKIGQFKEVGWKFDQWIDVGYWELIL